MAATMDRTYSVLVKGMLGEKSGSKVLYDKLLKVNAHKQFVDIAHRAGSDVIKPEHVLCTIWCVRVFHHVLLIYGHENAEMQKREFDDVTLRYSTGLQDIQHDK